MNVRLRRLQAEYERLKFVFDEHPHIHIESAAGDPPEHYTIEYRVKGLVEEGGGVIERDVHRAQIILGVDYPQCMPRCIMLTPVFHPNIDHLAICTEDIGSVDQRLEETVIFIGRMIAFQVHNVQSPRNGDAARWTKGNLHRLPIDPVDLFTDRLMDTAAAQRIAVRAAAEVSRIERERSRRCSNCGGPAAGATPCAAGHALCDECKASCHNCDAALCLPCKPSRCRSCGDIFCEDCAIACPHCDSWACLAHAGHACRACGQAVAIG